MPREAGESPPPERQSGRQLKDVPGSGRSTTQGQATKDWEQREGNKGTEGLTSNPKGPLDDEVAAKFAKTTK
ncbi:hypothetical protein SPI_09237 [Niveomyces insectorum RCEF 264]|uniref:Uncharacterized protein n=1 Tax=Niveomyces insectorum RCEF 264 TaxID=1081102 RepID=A0A167M1B6_9HYPO|nr:hypothetical protein SPI_09237 [Niveomyces insectorum RCEF 264]